MIRLGILFLVTCHLTWAASANAAESVLLTTDRTSDLGDRIEVLENLDGIHTVDDAVESGSWRTGTAPGIKAVARTGAQRAWIRFKVTNLFDAENWILEYARIPDFFEVHYRRIDGPGPWVSQAMEASPFSHRPVEHHFAALQIRLDQEASYEVYLQMAIRRGASLAVLPLKLYSDVAFAEHTRNTSLFYGLYFGVVLVMALYNLFLYLSLRDRAYIYYVMAILGFSLWASVYTGLGAQYLWPDGTWGYQRIYPGALGLAWLGLILFVREFLGTRTNAPRLDGTLRAFFVLYTCWPLASLLDLHDLIYRFGWMYELYLNLTLWLIFTIAGIVVLRRGYRPARFFLVAWAGYMTAGGVVNLTWLGLMQFNSFNAIGVFLAGHALEVVLLSLALADRINVLRTEKDQQENAAREAERRSQETREQSERKSAFLASMAHELRTPLNAIKGFNRLVLRRAGALLPDQERENLTKVDRASDHLLATINDLLDLSKIEAGRMDVNVTTFDVRIVILSACEVVSPLVQEGVDLRHDISSDIGEASTDQQRLSQMLINLLSNAIKFTDAGSVTVSASIGQGSGSAYGDAARQAESEVNGRYNLIVTVSDTGKGIPDSELGTLFDEYRQVEGQTESAVQRGTGLGLSITKRFAELLGGSISVASELGAGSTFTVSIPVRYAEISQEVEQ